MIEILHISIFNRKNLASIIRVRNLRACRLLTPMLNYSFKNVNQFELEDQLEETKESGFELREMYKKKQRKLEKQMLGESDSDEECDPKVTKG